jgi:hypothetical protein
MKFRLGSPANLNLAESLMKDMSIHSLVVDQIFDQIIRNFSLLAITVVFEENIADSP